jgi:hypothetical protein
VVVLAAWAQLRLRWSVLQLIGIASAAGLLLGGLRLLQA